MPRTPQPGPEPIPFLDDVLAFGDRAPGLERKFELTQAIRIMPGDAGRRLDRALLERLAGLYLGLTTAQATQRELRELLDQLDAPPWHPALFLRAVPTDLGPRAMVLYGGARRVVALADGIDLASLTTGEEVFLGKEATVVAGRSPWGTPQCGETASFERLTGDGRCVLRWRDEEVVVDVAGTLAAGGLRSGDQVRWDRAAWMVFEKMEGGGAKRFLLDELPDASRALVGGQEANLQALLAALTSSLIAPERAARYGLGGRRSVLLVGPPGCGKTLMARVAAAEVGRLAGGRCRFGVVKPAAWESEWVGGTQLNIRRCFRALREAAEEGSAVLFLDEIEAVGRVRGGSGNVHADKFLAALLAELDGFTDRTGVAVIAATNRKDLVDPALLERLSDVEIAVRRPDLRGARTIFDIHLPATVPMAEGQDRDELIEMAVSRLFSPNGDNALATLRFREGKTRTVAARELASGRMLAQVCRAACQRAFERDVGGGQPGVQMADVEEAVAKTIERLATTLTVSNVRAYLADLPQDVDVVSVEPVVRKVAHPYRYHHAA
jgi:ATP-dependent 26S proteasome regulatory subunit